LVDEEALKFMAANKLCADHLFYSNNGLLALQNHCANITIFHRKGIPSSFSTSALTSLAIRPICIDRAIVEAPVVTGLEIVP
jgi:hypothetical protein